MKAYVAGTSQNHLTMYSFFEEEENYQYFLGEKNLSKYLDTVTPCTMLSLTHCSLETPKEIFGKQCRPRSDAAECDVSSGSPLFANSSAIFLKEYLNNIPWHT